MKSVKILIIVLEILLAVGTSFSQNMSIGIRTGATYFTINNDEINEDTKYTMGLDLAIPFEYKLLPNFSIQPELHFTQKGVQFEEMEEGQKVDVAVKTNYLELPVLLKAQNGTEQFSYYLFLAPSLGYATNRFLTEKIGDGDKDKTDIDFIDEGVAQSQRWEFSTIGGVGASVKAGPGSLVLDIRYSIGLTDNTKFENDKPDNWEKTSNRGCTLSVGYVVPIGK